MGGGAVEIIHPPSTVQLSSSSSNDGGQKGWFPFFCLWLGGKKWGKQGKGGCGLRIVGGGVLAGC